MVLICTCVGRCTNCRVLIYTYFGRCTGSRVLMCPYVGRCTGFSVFAYTCVGSCTNSRVPIPVAPAWETGDHVNDWLCLCVFRVPHARNRQPCTWTPRRWGTTGWRWWRKAVPTVSASWSQERSVALSSNDAGGASLKGESRTFVEIWGGRHHGPFPSCFIPV